MQDAPHFPPPPPLPKKTRTFQRTPPAIFPPIFGAFGLGLAWRRAGETFAIPSEFGELILGAVTLLYLFAVVAYLAKVAQRPGVFREDLKVLPGRAGLAAMMLSGMLLAATLVVYSTALAQLVLVLAVGGHVILALTLIRDLVTGPVEARVVTPVWHLSYVGFILSPLAALPLGWGGYNTVVFWVSFTLAIVIWGISIRQVMVRDVPPPLRPLLAIHVAPASVLGTVAVLSGMPTLGLGLGLVAIVILAGLLVLGRWITTTGFSPLWGAFTFPLAAFSTLMQMLYLAGFGDVFRVLGGLALVAATLIIPVIAWKVMQLWMKGMLAVKTNAAQA
ncbi:tellurium resistance protein [Aliiroseovarius subalbicans]|uniref:SLAC1 family transporter n=1 Tax=Aliiroseovarius subalbicans TaxID=2925840 RepID=UPI001F58077A|nr:tellurium resistance protein [Aliiroseovarius subalbicans]MCI2398214.1 tellurium resistance protein [Aliiroseovarius subalbicans]